MATVRASQGFDLWFEALGDGPAIVFASRTPTEHLVLGRALADSFRVVLYEPRWYSIPEIPEGSMAFDELLSTSSDELELAQAEWMASLEIGASVESGTGHASELCKALAVRPKDHLLGRSLQLESAHLTAYPIQSDVEDLHAVADAAGVETFALAGYSGTGAYVAMLAPYSSRVDGLVVGGFPLLDSYEYWLGRHEGARDAAAAHGAIAHSASEALNALMLDLMDSRDERSLYEQIRGPKVVWFGGDDCERGWLPDRWRGARIARRLRGRRAELEALRFQVIELPGHTHATAAAQIKTAAALIRSAWSGAFADRASRADGLDRAAIETG